MDSRRTGRFRRFVRISRLNLQGPIDTHHVKPDDDFTTDVQHRNSALTGFMDHLHGGFPIQGDILLDKLNILAVQVILYPVAPRSGGGGINDDLLHT